MAVKSKPVSSKIMTRTIPERGSKDEDLLVLFRNKGDDRHTVPGNDSKVKGTLVQK